MGVWYAVRHRAPRAGAAIAVAGAARGVAGCARRRAPLRACGRVGLREPLLGAVARLARPRLPRRAAASARAAAARRAARRARGAPRGRAQRALGDGHADLREDALRGGLDRGAPRRGRVRQPPGSASGPRISPPAPRSWELSCSARSDASSVRADGHDAAARRALALIPAEAPVSATNSLGAHLSARKRIFSFPLLEEAEWVAVDTRRLTYLDSLRPARAREPLAALSATLVSARLRRGRRPRLPPALEHRDRLRQQVGAEAEREQLRAPVLVNRRERQRPDRVPGRQPRRRREQQAGRQPEIQASAASPRAPARRARRRGRAPRARA